MRRRRDQDYRGTRTTVDWPRLVYMVRLGKPGTLEVLQDAIEEYFPHQFDDAKQHAAENDDATGQEWVVSFNARRARSRFLRSQDPRSTRLDSPFWEYSVRSMESYGIPAYSAFVWSSRSGPRPPRALGWRTGGVRHRPR